MKTKTNFNKTSRKPRTLYSAVKSLTLSVVILSSAFTPVYSQVDSLKKPSWWFGVAAVEARECVKTSARGLARI